MFRMAKLTDYGIVLLTQFASRQDAAPLTARELAASAKLPLPTVGKLLKQLQHGGLLTSHRGTKGGYALARPAVDSDDHQRHRGAGRAARPDRVPGPRRLRAGELLLHPAELAGDQPDRSRRPVARHPRRHGAARPPSLGTSESSRLPVRDSGPIAEEQLMTSNPLLDELAQREYQHGFVTTSSPKRSRPGSPRTSSASSRRRRTSRSGSSSGASRPIATGSR